MPGRWLLMLASAALLFASAPMHAAVKTQIVHYPSGDSTISGFLALPQSHGKHPALVVIHEWWGLQPWVKEQAEKFAAQGYVALAVDLYRGQSTIDPAVARKLVSALPRDRAIADLQAAFAYLASRPDVDSSKIGDVGWCFGGGWALQLAIHQPKLAACAVNYGSLPTDSAEIDAIRCPVLGNFAGLDRGITPAKVQAFEAAMKRAGKSVNVKIYANDNHAFENPANKTGYRAGDAANAWQRMVAFFHRNLGG